MSSISPFLFLSFFILCIHDAVYCNKYTQPGKSDTCSDENGQQCGDQTRDLTDEGPSLIGRVAGLTRLDGVRVGHKRQVDLGDKVRTMTTLAMKPSLFEIPDFLSGDECEHVIALTMNKHMISSLARGGLTTKEDLEVPEIQSGQADGATGQFSSWDFNNDNKITLEEALKLAKSNFYLHLKKEELLDALHKVNVFELDNGVITRDQFKTMNTRGIDDIMYVTSMTHPRHRPRYSEQAWLNQRGLHDPVLNAITERVIKLTNLSREIVYGSERLQVVRYDKHGHYNAHHDSETHTRTDVPCCQHKTEIHRFMSFEKPCRICRYMTIMYYLNNVQAGGETAFPVADNKTLNISILGDSRDKLDYFNLSHNCYAGNLVVTPKRGTAIMWYNHFLDEESGWMGAMDDYSLHGGCDIHEGIKWIANNWITAPYKDSAHIRSEWLEFYD